MQIHTHLHIIATMLQKYFFVFSKAALYLSYKTKHNETNQQHRRGSISHYVYHGSSNYLYYLVNPP